MQNVSYIIFEVPVLQKISDFLEQKGFSTEQGGLLLGLRRGPTIHVTSCTFPGPKDVSKRFSFIRQDSKHRKSATDAWSNTDYTTDWVGEWHSHPEHFPKPPTIDCQSWQSQCRRRKAAMAYLIFGISDRWVGLQEPHYSKVRAIAPLGQTAERLLCA
jgi:integrative and conjugative element protein (TIGR02256 family)